MDLNGDSVLDVVNGRYSPSAIYWFRGLGDGNGFAPREELLPGDKRWSMSIILCREGAANAVR